MFIECIFLYLDRAVPFKQKRLKSLAGTNLKASQFSNNITQFLCIISAPGNISKPISLIRLNVGTIERSRQLAINLKG